MSISSRPHHGQMLPAARGYAARGWKVIPVHSVTLDGSCTCGATDCKSIGKHPTQKDWPKQATSDPASIEELWKRSTFANVGIATGATSGVFVVDLDGTEGIAAFKALAEKYGGMPSTYTVITGSGGRHHYFRYPTDRIIRNRTKINGQPIDVRGDGGQVLAPPSLHWSGETYTVDNDIEPVEAPTWLLDLVAPPSADGVVVENSTPPSPFDLMNRRISGAGADLPSRIRAYLAKCPPAISGQGGHNRTFSVTNALIHGFGLTADEAIPYLREWNETCQPPWNAKDLAHKLNEAVSKGGPPRGQARGYLLRDEATIPISTTKALRILPIEPWVPFPVEALPEPLRSFVVEGAGALGCDPAFLAVPGLAVVGGTIGNTRHIALKRNWSEPPIIWSVIVGDSGSMKTPALKLVSKHVQDQQSRMFDQYESDKADFKAAFASYEREFEQWKKSKQERQAPEEPVSPVCRRILVSDTTVEKLASILGDNPRGVLAIRDELAGWFSSFNQYKGKSGSDVASWLELQTGGGLTVDRKGGETIHVPQATVSLTGGIQPAILARSLSREHRESGLAARLLFAKPPKRAKEWTEAELPEHVDKSFRLLIERLIALEGKIDSDKRPSPLTLNLTPEARDIWKTFYDRLAKRQEVADGDLAAVYAKIEAYAARLALIHHIVCQVHEGLDGITSIGPESMRAGIALADWFARETERVYDILSESDDERELRALQELISRKGGSITPRELQRSNGRRYRTTEAALVALTSLATAGAGEMITEAPTNGGHSTVRFTLFDVRRPTCPTVDDSLPSSNIPTMADTQSKDVDDPLENEASVGHVGRRAVENDSSSDREQSSPVTSCVGQRNG